MFYTFIIFSFGVYIGQEYLLLPSVKIMLERTIFLIQEQYTQYTQIQAQQAQDQQAPPQNNYFGWRFFRNTH
jgi:hypothetical protein